MRRALLAAVAATAIAAPAAQAQAPVVAGVTYATAPVVGPGTYQDTVLPREERFYAIRVARGQAVRATLRTDAGERRFDAVSRLEVNVAGPLRETFTGYAGADDPNITDPGDGADITSPTADAGEDDDPYTGPGLWYVAVNAPTGADEPLPVELPYTLTVALVGEAQPSPTPAATATAGPAGEAPAGGDADEDPPRTAQAAVGFGGLLVGAAAGAALARRRRRA